MQPAHAPFWQDTSVALLKPPFPYLLQKHPLCTPQIPQRRQRCAGVLSALQKLTVQGWPWCLPNSKKLQSRNLKMTTAWEAGEDIIAGAS